MAEEIDLEKTISQLSRKIDEQARFTRSVIVICTLAVLGVMFYTLTELFSKLPGSIVMHYRSNLDEIVKEWKMCELSQSRQKSLPPPAAPPAAAPPAAAPPIAAPPPPTAK